MAVNFMRRSLATPVPAAISGADLAKTRNIGIIAHIDAGKTTTTERMLYYSGYTRRIGDVDDGSTVTDFLPAERARGITIQSAAITFHWPPEDQMKASSSEASSSPIASRPDGRYTINLIDTPGHADFTFEVLRSLRILDGAVCILDGVAGVEAQTEKVWAQANLYRIPRIIFVNKLDRDGAAFSRTVKEIGARLHGWPAVCQMPWWHSDTGALCGVGDVIGLRGLLYTKGSDGRTVDNFTLQELDERDLKLAEELRRARVALVELLSEHDEEMVEKFLTCDEDHLAISPTDIVQSLRRCVLQFPQAVIPVFSGASFRNVGVQPLLDAVLDLMPSPTERPDPEVSIAETSSTLNTVVTGQFPVVQPATATTTTKTKSGKGGAIFQNMQACALAFKVVNDPKRGVLVYVRVYSGSLDKGAPLYNTNLGVTERAQRLLRMYANDAVDIDRIPAGHIGVIPGLKHARTGDTLIVYGNVNPKAGPPAPINSLQLRPITVPPPVFFTGVRPNSLSEERHLEQALQTLLREDPSLSVSLDQESGQTHLAGMGELHLEIARDRLLSDFKAKATTGKIEIGYREAILQSSSSNSSNLDSEIAGKRVHAGSVATVTPLDDTALPPSGDRSIANETVVMLDANRLIVRHPTLTAAGKAISPDDPSIPGHLSMKDVLSAIRTGVSAALAHVPGNGYPAHSIQVEIDLHPATQLYADTSPSALSSATRQAVHAALKQAATSTGSVLMEPVMTVTIAMPESAMGDVIHDLSSARGGQVLALDSDSDGQQATEDDTLTIDISKVYAPPDPFEGSVGSGVDSSTNPQRQITARVPLKEMVGYLKHLRSLTGGRGTFTMSVDRFERMSSQRMKAVLNEMRGDEVY